MIFLTTFTTITTVFFFIFFYLLSQFFWKEQFDTFDNGCDVLRAAFCDSRDVFFVGGVSNLSKFQLP